MKRYNPSQRSVLLDSHVLVWLANGEGLGKEARSLIAQADSIYASTASFWELSIKAQLGKIQLPKDFEDAVLATGISELYVTKRHTQALRLEKFQTLDTNDPFDRILLIQACCDNLTFLTADTSLLSFESALVNAQD